MDEQRDNLQHPDYSEPDKLPFYVALGFYMAIGSQFVVTLFLLSWGGMVLDQKLALSPLFLLVGMGLGLSLGLYNMMRQINGRKKPDSEST